jgi:hypothetical protein
MTHLTLVCFEVIHDRRLVSVMRLALLLSSAAKLSILCITRWHPRDQLFLNLFLVCKKPPFSADCLFAQELNFRPQLMRSIFGRSEFHWQPNAPTLEAAKAEFQASWRQWLPWAKLGEIQ